MVTDEEENAAFLQVYRPYPQNATDHISGRIDSSDLISSMSVFDPHHLPEKEAELSRYGMEKM